MTVYAEYETEDRRYFATVHTDGKTFLYEGFYWIDPLGFTQEQQTGLHLMGAVWLCGTCKQRGEGDWGGFQFCPEHKAQLDSIKWDPHYLLEREN